MSALKPTFSTAVVGKKNKPKHLKLGAVILVVIFLVILVVYLLIHQSGKSYTTVFKKSEIALNKRDYKTALSLLNSVKNQPAAKSDYKFYTDIARAEYLVGSKAKAKAYAQTGGALYNESKNKDSAYVVILLDITSDTYTDIPISNPALNNATQPVTEEQINDPNFQG